MNKIELTYPLIISAHNVTRFCTNGHKYNNNINRYFIGYKANNGIIYSIVCEHISTILPTDVWILMRSCGYTRIHNTKVSEEIINHYNEYRSRLQFIIMYMPHFFINREYPVDIWGQICGLLP